MLIFSNFKRGECFLHSGLELCVILLNFKGGKGNYPIIFLRESKSQIL